MARERILVADDDEDIRELLTDRLEAMGYRVLLAKDGKETLESIRRQSPDLVFLDIEMPEMDGFQVLEKIGEEGLDPTVVVITAHGNVKTAVRSMRLGAYDFLEKPFNTGRIEVVVQKALRQAHLQREHEVLQEVLSEQLPTLIAESSNMAEILQTAKRAAASDATVLLLGESGTGKEVLARAIHEWSERRDGPFVAINCAALPDQLLESTLFGHEKGSFTGATSQKKGKFEAARDASSEPVTELEVDAYHAGRSETSTSYEATSLQPGPGVESSSALMELQSSRTRSTISSTTSVTRETAHAACQEGLSAEATIDHLFEEVTQFGEEADRTDDMACGLK